MKEQAQPTTSPVVLYVEDEENDVLFMRAAFRRQGIDVPLQTVPNGQEAISYLAGDPPFADRQQHPFPAVVLLDVNLPLRSGFEVLHWIRQQPQLEALKVVMFSSSGRPEDRQRATELGATDYALKPSSGMQFSEVARTLVSKWL